MPGSWNGWGTGREETLMSSVSIEPRENVGVVRLTYGVTNPIGPELVESLSSALRQARSEFQALVLAGGDKFFSIGFDLPTLLDLDRSGMTAFFHGFGDLVLDLYTLPMPTVCAVKRHAVAGGTILMLTTDYRFASSGRTLVGLNEIRLGVPVPYAADLMLRQLVAERVATEVICRGELVEASSMQASGLVDRILPADDVESHAVEFAAELAGFSPDAFAALKENRVEEVKKRYDAHGRERNERFLDVWFTPSAQEGLREAAKTF
jgi:enoyl-CoA hydratase/carnithine racemase